MTQGQLDKVLERHEHWLHKDIDSWETIRANLQGENLRNADLRYANLRDADLCGACLSNSDLLYADLQGANLSNANLQYANLYGADLRSTNLQGIDLRDADLRDADLRDADLHGAKLNNTKLNGADLCGAKGVPYIPLVCPSDGEFIAWKKARGVIVKLLIPSNARRTSGTSRMCRCDIAIVLEIQTIDGEKSKSDEVASFYDRDFIYKVGETVEVKDFCENRFKECAEGIHFFVDRQEAVDYEF